MESKRTLYIVTGIGIILGVFNLWRSDGPGTARNLGIGLLAASIICLIALMLGVGPSKKP